MSNIGNKEIFAKNLLYYVERSDKSQREIAEAVDVSRSTFNEWIKGKKYPRIDKIELLANYFRIKKSDLIEDKKNLPNDERTDLTEGEQMWLELFRRLPESSKPKALLLFDLLEQVPEEKQEMLLDILQVTLKKR